MLQIKDLAHAIVVEIDPWEKFGKVETKHGVKPNAIAFCQKQKLNRFSSIQCFAHLNY
jgi:hypothetical protein